MGHNHWPVATKGRTAAYPVRVRRGGTPEQRYLPMKSSFLALGDPYLTAASPLTHGPRRPLDHSPHQAVVQFVKNSRQVPGQVWEWGHRHGPRGARERAWYGP